MRRPKLGLGFWVLGFGLETDNQKRAALGGPDLRTGRDAVVVGRAARPEVMPYLVAFLLMIVTAVARPPGVDTFTEKYCASCHNDVDKEAGLDLTALEFKPMDAENLRKWVRVFDRVAEHEMPPKEKKQPAADKMETFLQHLRRDITAHETAVVAQEGRAVRRRLNGYEYENALRDLLGAPWLQVKGQFPEDGEAHRFNKVGDALDVSHVHMARYMNAADYAIRQVLSVKHTRPPTSVVRHYARDQRTLTSKFVGSIFNSSPDRMTFPVIGLNTAQPDVRWLRAPLTVGDANPELRDQEAIGWVSSNYVTGFTYRWDGFRAPVAGRYRVKFSGYTLWLPPGGIQMRFNGEKDKIGTPRPPNPNVGDYDNPQPGRRHEPVTVYTRNGVMNRRVGEFDLTPEPSVFDLGEIWLLANETLVPDASRLYRSRPNNFRNPLMTEEGAPGVAFRWMEIEGPIYDEGTLAGYNLLFGDLPLRRVNDHTKKSTLAARGPLDGRDGPPGGQALPSDSMTASAQARGLTIPVIASGDRRESGRNAGQRLIPLEEVMVEVVSDNPRQDAEHLLRGFVARAYRRPAVEADIQRFLALFDDRSKAGLSFTEAMAAMYTAVLASPGFVFVDEQPGPLDDHALATRLVLFLWNSEPDRKLRDRALRGELRDSAVLKAETERLLDDPKAQRFVEAFLDYWLDLRKLEDTTPSTTLYNDYYLDDALVEAAALETRQFFTELVQRDLPVRNLVNADFTFLNERLAIHYGIPGVIGSNVRRVPLPSDSVRGGLLTQASVLKVTANGTTTSPVLRGKWILERLLGIDIPPPPPVPAVEPDIRGAVTIRQQLDKHRADASCASCHRKMDPPGFALESFDVMGAWRERYRAVDPEKPAIKGLGKNGQPFEYHFGLPVDAAGELPDGRPFADVREFKERLRGNDELLARNLARQLVVYATGAPVRFSDRPAVEAIVEQTKANDYGVRSLVHAIVQSSLFREK